MSNIRILDGESVRIDRVIYVAAGSEVLSAPVAVLAGVADLRSNAA